MNKHLVNIIQKYVKTTQPFLKEFKNKTRMLYCQLEDYAYYDTYTISHWTWNGSRRNKQRQNNYLKVRYSKFYERWHISSE
jgi:hypothetical protein